MNVRFGYYILDGQTPVHEPDHMAWGRWMEDADRHVDYTTLHATSRALSVSTVFLGLNHRHFGDGPPILFETMCFIDHRDGRTEFGDEQFRYCTWDEAQAGHNAIVAALHARYVKEGVK